MTENLVYITKENFEAEVKNSDKPILIDFWAEWCAPCRMMEPVFEGMAPKYKGIVKFAKLNTQEEQALAASFAIQGIPSLVLLKDGKEVDRFVGAMPETILAEKLDVALKKI
ncbi:thioredoxin [archaeon]|nr:thioredoxin [archaeon]